MVVDCFYLTARGIPDATAPKILSIAPGAAMLPENTLRLYLNFDRPSRGLFRQGDIGLFHEDGRIVIDPFVDFGQELWSPDGRRLTILFEPSRIKRGVMAMDGTTGLQSGNRYVLHAGSLRYCFQAAAPLRSRLDPLRWRFTPPNHPEQAVRIGFDRIMDAALLSSQILILDAHGNIARTRPHVSPDGRALRLAPQRPWRGCETYFAVFGRSLEDAAGNRLSEMLDQAVGRTLHPATTALCPFRIARSRPGCRCAILTITPNRTAHLGLRAALLGSLYNASLLK
jgi:hypothetical protein